MRTIKSILTVGILVLLVGLMLFGCRSKEVESALIYINQQNDWEKAMEQLDIAVQVNPGDVNNDYSIDVIDALLIAQYIVGLNPEGFNTATADVTNNGSIDIVDALMIAQCSVGLVSCDF